MAQLKALKPSFPLDTKALATYQALPAANQSLFRKALSELLKPANADADALMGTPKSDDYQSEWADHVVRVERDGKTKVFNLTSEVVDGTEPLLLPLHGPLSPFDTPQTFDTFPHLRRTLKAWINHWLNAMTKRLSELVKHLNCLLHFLAWMIGHKGVYDIAALTSEDFTEFATQMAEKGGWGQLLGLEEQLFLALDKATKSSSRLEVVKQITRGSSKGLQLKDGTCRMLVGWSTKFLPPAFGAELASWHPENPTPPEMKRYRLSVGQLKDHFSAINYLYLLPDTVSKATCYPYKAAAKLASELFRESGGNAPEGRTKNLELDEAIRLLKESLTVIYDQGADIIALHNAARNRLEKIRSEFPGRSWEYIKKCKYSDEKSKEEGKLRIHKIESEFDAKVRSICAQHNLPCDTIKISTRDKYRASSPGRIVLPLRDLTLSLMSACFTVIGVTHARRLNEIQGENGLYFGCIQSRDEDGLPMIDCYVEKTYKNYAEFYCGKLAQDAVKLLEELQQAFRPLGSKPLKPYKSKAQARQRKLFRYCADMSTYNSFEILSDFNYSKGSESLFERAGVVREGISRHAHIFRRFFALVYYYRHDDKSLLALSQHLCHLDPGMTWVYISDPTTREASERIEKLYDDQQAVQKHLDDVRSEIFTDTIMKILLGDEDVLKGGDWPRLILKVYERLMHDDVTFREQELSAQARETAKELEDLGFSREPHRTNGCNIGTATITLAESPCFSDEDGLAHPEIASPMMCAGCPNSDCFDHHLHALERDADQLDQQTDAMGWNVPVFLKDELRKQAMQLRELSAREKKVGQEFKHLLAGIVQHVTSLTEPQNDDAEQYTAESAE